MFPSAWPSPPGAPHLVQQQLRGRGRQPEHVTLERSAAGGAAAEEGGVGHALKIDEQLLHLRAVGGGWGRLQEFKQTPLGKPPKASTRCCCCCCARACGRWHQG